MGKIGTGAAKTPRPLGDGQDFGLPYLSVEKANVRIVEYYQEVGDLKCANKLLDATNEGLKKRNATLARRNASLEDAIKTISSKCVWRECKCCDVNCRGRTYCEVQGLNPISL